MYFEDGTELGDQFLNEEEHNVPVTLQEVRKFKKMIRKPNGSLKVFHLGEKNNVNLRKESYFEYSKSASEVSRGISAVMKKWKSLFRDDLPTGLPPRQSFDHEILLEKGMKLLHRPLFRLPPEKQKYANNYMNSLKKKEKTRQSNPFMGYNWLLCTKIVAVCVELLINTQWIR